MENKITYDEIMALFKETRASIEATGAQLKEIGASIKATDAQMKATDAKIEATDAQIKATGAQMKATDERLEKIFAKTEAEIDKLSKYYGGISRNNGEFAEEYFANSFEQKKDFAGIKFDYFDRKVSARHGKTQDEFDIVLYNGTAIGIIEVKYKVHLDDLEKLVTKKVNNFREIFPFYANHKIYLGIGSMAFYNDVISKAKELGIGILRQKGETIESDTQHIKAY